MTDQEFRGTNQTGGGTGTVAALDRLIAAARKIHDGPGYHPAHLGGCIGPLSDVKCECGITDLHFAVRGYDRAVRDAAIALGDIQPPTLAPCGRCCWPEDCEEGCVKA